MRSEKRWTNIVITYKHADPSKARNAFTDTNFSQRELFKDIFRVFKKIFFIYNFAYVHYLLIVQLFQLEFKLYIL